MGLSQMPSPPNRSDQTTTGISYASSAKSRIWQWVIRGIENATGRIGLIRRGAGYAADITAENDFWEVMAKRYRMSFEVIGGSLENIPKHGPVVIVSNHPFGILDGFMLGFIIRQVRKDFNILAHHVFQNAPELDDVILPISFDATKEATKLNLNSRKVAIDLLNNGEVVAIFPGGTVSTSQTMFSDPLDPKWRPFTAKMIVKSQASVVPIFFQGANSRLFQIACHLHYYLRVAFLLREFKAKIDHPVRVVIGEPIGPKTLAPYRTDPQKMMAFLRTQTYALDPEQRDPTQLGYEYDALYRD